jgi:hypothetical protein
MSFAISLNKKLDSTYKRSAFVVVSLLVLLSVFSIVVAGYFYWKAYLSDRTLVWMCNKEIIARELNIPPHFKDLSEAASPKYVQLNNLANERTANPWSLKTRQWEHGYTFRACHERSYLSSALDCINTSLEAAYYSLVLAFVSLILAIVIPWLRKLGSWVLMR